MDPESARRKVKLTERPPYTILLREAQARAWVEILRASGDNAETAGELHENTVADRVSVAISSDG